MNPHLDDLLASIRALEEEVEATYRETVEELERQRVDLAGEFLRRQHRYRIGLLRFLARSKPLVLLTVPLIYAGWVPFLLMDLFVTVYQATCFPIYRIPRVHRSSYLIFDREGLPYLNLFERINCFYCTYSNGVVAYTREVAARTEQYWCPIKHARRLPGAHDAYPKFFAYGDAEAYRTELERLRRDYAELRATLDKR